MSYLTTKPFNPLLDLPPWVGQRSVTYRFDRVDGATGEKLGQITPLRGPTLSHNTTRTVKRQLTLDLGVADTAAINPISDRIDLVMVLSSGEEWPLGRYMFVDDTRQIFTSGELASVSLWDEGFLVDLPLETGFSANGNSIPVAILALLSGLVTDPYIESSPYSSVQGWPAGSGRGQVLEALALTGDYFSPWFGNDKRFRCIRSFDPATQVPTFDFDAGNSVIRSGIVQSSDILTAPNRFVVVSNAATDPSAVASGSADVPSTAPHSIANRGFVLPDVQTLQVADSVQAAAVAQNLARRQAVVERVELATAPDPRHDSYDVVRWQGELWLEIAWSMQLIEGGEQLHTLRKSYSS